MIDILKKEVERKIGRQITNRGDCELLSNIILEANDIEISFNTLRRLYGIIPNTKPNIKTLDTLSKYLGYKNFIHFTQTQEYRDKIYFFEEIYQIIGEEKDENIINLIIKTKNSSEDFISLIITLTRELLHDENYTLIDQIFKLKELNFNTFTYSEVIQLGNAVGLLLRKKTNIDSLLLNNINFLECIFLTYVDYSNLNNYYGDSLEIIKNNNIRSDITIFSKASLEFRNFLNNKSIIELNILDINKSKLHPILKGRLLTLKLLAAKENKTLEIIKTHHSTIKKEVAFVTHYYELFTTSILLKNFEIMLFLIEKISLKIEFYYQKTQLNSFYLMCLFYYKFIGDLENEKKFVEVFKLNECRHGYKEFITLIYYIYQFNSEVNTEKKETIKSNYLMLSKKLNYAFFSEFFFMTYFQ